ncbi:MAG: M15 family metallopeptidase [Candidatus Hinthialibacter antarcticus]|nr:M15 family metallopeptidase [Candidatus Hinthialibacter antarcticus]
MKRRQFIALSGFSAPLVIVSAKSQALTQIPESELLGKTAPSLFDGVNFNFRQEAADAFVKMQNAAKKDGIKIYSVSSYRGFKHQLGIWNRKYSNYQKRMKKPEDIIAAIVEFSSIPGTSRHHWGTDADLVDDSQKRPRNLLYSNHFLKGGLYENFYRWMKTHASEFGFHEVYTDDPERSGYKFEPWHWSYAPLSVPFLRQWSQIDLHKKIAQPPLMGREHLTAEFLEVFRQKWGLGINPALLPK